MFIALTVALLSVPSAKPPAEVELALRYDAGHTYRITTTEKRKTRSGGKTDRTNSTVVSERVVSVGGQYKRSPITWVETMTEGPDEVTGLAYRVQIAADGTLEIDQITVPMEELVEVFTPEFFGAILEKGMGPWEPRTIKVGARWTLDLTDSVPLIQGKMGISWRVKSIKKGVAYLVSRATSTSGAVSGTGKAEIVLETGLLRLTDTKLTLKMKFGGRKVTARTHTRIEMKRLPTIPSVQNTE
ncbi:MAG: hypothetical protein ACI9OJ_004567 [Myxococcota bacterium]|jgi:hypothetical protein